MHNASIQPDQPELKFDERPLQNVREALLGIQEDGTFNEALIGHSPCSAPTPYVDRILEIQKIMKKIETTLFQITTDGVDFPSDEQGIHETALSVIAQTINNVNTPEGHQLRCSPAVLEKACSTFAQRYAKYQREEDWYWIES